MAQLFDKDSDTIGLHLKNIYQSGELEEHTTTEESSVVQQEGNNPVTLKRVAGWIYRIKKVSKLNRIFNNEHHRVSND